MHLRVSDLGSRMNSVIAVTDEVGLTQMRDPDGLASVTTDMTACTAAFDPTPEEYGPPYQIDTKNDVSRKAKPGADDPFTTEDVYQDFRANDVRYGPSGAYIETGDPRAHPGVKVPYRRK